MNQHVGDDAELYALGLLEPESRARIDAHLATCDACLRLVGEAEETALQLAALLPVATPSPQSRARLLAAAGEPAPVRPLAWAGALAAALLLIALGGAWLQMGPARERRHASELAVATLVHSHFLHEAMETRAGAGGLAAKVVYARDGSWFYVLVDRAGGEIDVDATIAGRRWLAGAALREGDTATLLARPPARADSVELSRDGNVLASVRLRYR